MITSKIRTRHWFLLILLVVVLVLFPIAPAFAVALSRGEQYHVVAEEFQSVFILSLYAGMILLAVSLIIGAICFKRGRRRKE